MDSFLNTYKRVSKTTVTLPTERVISYLGLGSSIGDRAAHLRSALQRLNSESTRVTALSSVYESPHLGLAPGDSERYPPHLNCVAQVETSLSPNDLLDSVLEIERAGGRERAERWSPRTIDIDILLYGAVSESSPRLTLPHPGIAKRAFVALPLAELAPQLTLPSGERLAETVLSETIQQQAIRRVAGLALSLAE